MLKLLEHQVKALLKEKGVRVPEACLVDYDKLLLGTEVVYRNGFILKAQIPVSSRYKKGLIVTAQRKEDLPKAGRKIFQKAKKYGGCSWLLLEEKIPHSHAKEMYLAVLSDPATRGPVVVFHASGGIEIERVLKTSKKDGVFYVVGILRGFEPDKFDQRLKHIRGLTVGMRAELSKCAKRLYALYREWDACFVEVNPLVLCEDGLWALDAKMGLDEDALFRLEEKMKSRDFSLEGADKRSLLEADAARIDLHDYRGSAHFVQNDIQRAAKKCGKVFRAVIGFNGVGTGVSLTAMDELVKNGFFPRNFCDTSGNPPASKLYRITKIILKQDGIQGYFFISCVSSQQLDNTARGILKAFQEKYASRGGVPDIPTLLHFRGAWDEEAKAIFREHGISEAKNVLILGRESSERAAAEKFARLYAETR